MMRDSRIRISGVIAWLMMPVIVFALIYGLSHSRLGHKVDQWIHGPKHSEKDKPL